MKKLLIFIEPIIVSLPTVYRKARITLASQGNSERERMRQIQSRGEESQQEREREREREREKEREGEREDGVSADIQTESYGGNISAILNEESHMESWIYHI